MDADSCRSEGETTWSSTTNIIGPSCRFLAAPTDAALLRRHSWATCGSFPNKSMRRWDSIFGQMYDINPQDGPLPNDFELFGFSENPGISIYKSFSIWYFSLKHIQGFTNWWYTDNKSSDRMEYTNPMRPVEYIIEFVVIPKPELWFPTFTGMGSTKHHGRLDGTLSRCFLFELYFSFNQRFMCL